VPSSAPVVHGSRPVAPVDEDVVGLEIAVYHAHSVRLSQRRGGLAEQLGGLGDRQRTAVAQVVAQAAAVHQVHHEPERRPDADQVTHPDHVVVAQGQQDGPFLHEPGDELRLPGKVVAQQLDRHRFAAIAVQRPPHGTGGAVPDRLDQDVRVAHAAARHLSGQTVRAAVRTAGFRAGPHVS